MGVLSGGLTWGFFVSNVSSLDDLVGWAACGSAAVVVWGGGGVAGCAWDAPGGGTYHIVGAGASMGLGLPVAVTGEATYTGRSPGWLRPALRALLGGSTTKKQLCNAYCN